MPAVYLLDSDELPLPMVPAGLLDPNVAAPANPTVFESFAAGLTAGFAYLLNKNSRRTENIARYGGGAYAPCEGCDLSMPTGLTLLMSTGAVMMDGPQVYPSIKSLPIPNNLYNAGDITVRAHIWLSKTGDLSYRTDLTQPATTSAYLGSVRTSGGVVHDIDYSGRVELRGIPYRRTADAGVPNADLPAKWRGLVRTAGALYWWDGTDYFSTLDANTVYADDTDINPGNLLAKIQAGDGITVEVVEVDGERVLQVTNTGISDDTDLMLLLPLDGSRAMTQPLNFGGEKGINQADGVLSTDSSTVGQVATAKSQAISAAATATNDLAKLNGTRAYTGNHDFGGYRGENAGAPVSGGDLVNKTYADGLLIGIVGTDRLVRTDSSDTTPGALADKITYSRGLLTAPTGPGAGDRKFNFALAKSTITLPKFSVTCPPGEERIIRVEFGDSNVSPTYDIGSFPDELLYEVVALVSNNSGGTTPPNERFVLEELPNQNDSLYGFADTGIAKGKNTRQCFLRLHNYSPDDWAPGTPGTQSDTFYIAVYLKGLGWVAGANPSADPNVTVYSYSSEKAVTFELDPLTVPKGTTGLVEVDFSGLGQYNGQYFVQAEPANDDASVWALCSGRTGKTFRLKVENTADAASADVTLTCTLQGKRWFDVSEALNPDTPGDPSATVLTTTSAQEQISIATFGEAEPDGGWATVLRFPCHKAVTVGNTAMLAISRAHCETRPSSAAEFEIYDLEPGVGQTLIGLVTFTSASDTGTFDFASYDGEVVVDAGHVIKFVAGAGAEAPLAGWSINLIGLIDRD